MKTTYDFQTNEESKDFCDEIAREMMRTVGFGLEEAVGRINRHWSGVDFVAADDLRYHEAPDFWARDVAYGSDVPWHQNPPGMKPLPYP